VTTPWKTYQVDGEVGRFEFSTHQVVHAGKTQYDTAQAVFPRRRCWEWYKTRGFKELAYIYGAIEESYRKTSRLINRVRYQVEGGTPSRTVREQAEGEGRRLMQAIDRKAEQILQAHGVTQEGLDDGEPETAPGQRPVTLPEAQVASALARCQERVPVACDLSQNPVPYEAPAGTLNITIDDVAVKRQKAERASPTQDSRPATPPEKRKRKAVQTTVVHLEHDSQSYLIAGHGITHVLRLVLALILNSGLVGFRFQFFTDGYTLLHDAIRRGFSWYANLAIILDWYHLEEKCKRQFSLAMKGRELRNEALTQLLPLLWYGLVDQAIAFIEALATSSIKNPEAITTLIRYVARNRAHIPCYAARKELGLRNSSQIGEKMNDLVVSERQKHHGMSWSVSGSVALASLTVLARNHEYAQWFDEGDIAFTLAA
jgi:hypothetical protein